MVWSCAAVLKGRKVQRIGNLHNIILCSVRQIKTGVGAGGAGAPKKTALKKAVL
jgi:hypothetical protein